MRINLFTNYFKHPVRKRMAEYDYCAKRNAGWFKKYPPQFDNIIVSYGQPTFADYFKLMSKFPDDCNVLANLDIFFDESIHLAKNIQPDTAYCITRHEYMITETITFLERHGHIGEWSQDCWVFTGNKILDLVGDANFPLGSRGCDNHMAWLLKYHGFKILNPAKDIKIMHYHVNETNDSRMRGEKVGDPSRYLPLKPDNIKMI